MSSRMGEKYDIVLYLPNEILDSLFSYLNPSDLRNCALVCRHWRKYLLRENVWRHHCYKLLSPSLLSGDILSNIKSYRSKIRAYVHAWNPNDCSKHIYVKSDGFTLHRNPVAQSTDAIRSKLGFQYGQHVWEIKWDSPLGTVAVVGIATKEAPLQCNGYIPLIGSNEYSWGWNLAENNLIHKGELCGNYPLLVNAPKYEVGYAYENSGIRIEMILNLMFSIFQVGEKIRVVLNCELGTLAFERNYEFLGIAFKSKFND